MGRGFAHKHRIFGWVEGLREFYALSQRVRPEFLQSINRKNSVVIFTAAWLTIAIEISMIIRVFVSHPTLGTPASRVYLALYCLLIVISVAALLIRPYLKGKPNALYWFAFVFATLYLVWNMLLNSYDLYRNGRGSSLAMVMAIVLASILLQFKPHHAMALQFCTYCMFFSINTNRIEDTINAGIAVTTAMLANFLFYYQQVQSVHSQMRIEQMRLQIENEQLEGARRYLRRLQSAQTQTAIYHHDMRHTFHLLNQLLQRGDYKKMYAVIADNEAQLGEMHQNFYCAHETANLLLGSFEERARGHEVAFQAQAMLPQSLPIADGELCALLCNLLENALNAVQKVPQPAARRIYVRVVHTAPNLVFFVENTYHDEVKLVQDRPMRATPAARHGLGIQSIVDIAERYHGLYDFAVDGKVFRAKVLLKLADDGVEK